MRKKEEDEVILQKIEVKLQKKEENL